MEKLVLMPQKLISTSKQRATFPGQAPNPLPLPVHHHHHTSLPPISTKHFPRKLSPAQTKSVKPSYAIKYCTYSRHTASLCKKAPSQLGIRMLGVWSVICPLGSTKFNILLISAVWV